MKRSGSRFLDSELRDNYWFVQSFIFRLKKIIAALSSESLKKNKEDFISHLIYLGQSSVKDNEGLNKVNEFINFWNNKKLPATHRINKTKERLLEVGSLFKDLKNKSKNRN